MQTLKNTIIDGIVVITAACATVLVIITLSPYLSFYTAPYLPSIFPIVFSAWYRGLRAGMLMTVISALAIKYLLLPSSSQAYQLILFLSIGFIISLVFELLRRAYAHAEASAYTLMENEQRYKQVIENVGDLVCLIDVFGTITYISPSVKKVLGFTPEELQNKNIFDYIYEKDLISIQLEFENALRGDKAPPTIVRLKNIRNQWVILEASGSAIFNRKSMSHLIVVTARDITVRKNYEERLNELNTKISNILQSISDAFFALDNEGRFVYLNRQAEKLLNVRKDFMIGKSVWNEFPDIIDATFYGKYFRVVATQEPVIFEKYYKPMNKWFEIHAFPGKDGLSVYFADITDRKKTEEALRENEERFRLLSESVPQIIWTAKSDGDIDYYNKRWYEYTTLTYDQSRDWKWKRVIHPDDLNACLKLWEQSLKTGKKYEVQARLKRGRDNLYIWHLIRAVPIKNSEKKIIRWFGTCTDIDQQKKLDERKDEFISTASHELKTPLTTVKAFTQLLQNRFKEDKFPEVNLYLYKMDQQLNKLRSLVNNLLDVSKIQAGKFEFIEKYFDINELIRETVEEVSASANSHMIIIKGSTQVFIVYGDRYRIGQVLTNLLSNAIKYSPNGKKVNIHTTVKQNYVTIAVEDFGIGIADEETKGIFDRFYRVDGNNSERFEGLGLGLHIAQEIIRMHKGKIWVKSRVGSGSTFYFSLPLSRAGTNPRKKLEERTYGSYEKSRLSN